MLAAHTICVPLVYAQHEVVQALEDSLATAESDQRRIDILNSLAVNSFEYDLALSQNWAEEAKELAGSIGYQAGIADANRWLGKIYNAKGKTPESLEFFMNALAVYEAMEDSVELADIYKNLANVYSNNGNNHEAMRYYNISMDIYKSINDRRGESAILNNIGTVYLSMNNADSALYYLNQSRLSSIEVQDKRILATNYTNMGYAYAIMEDFPKAIEYYMKSYEIASELNGKETMSTALLNVGDSYMYLGEYDKAEQSVREGLEISESEGYIYNNYIGYYTLGEINELREDYKESLNWYHRAEGLKEELTNSATINALMDVQSKQLEAAQAREIERINILNSERIEKERVKNLLFLSLAILALVVLLGITYYYKRQHANLLKIAAQNEEINLQKEQIEEQSAKIRQVNDILTQRNKRLRELNEDKSFMMSVVAHDLKSPLNQINGLANVIKLEDDRLSESQKECLENIDNASSRLKDFIDKILEGRNASKLSTNLKVEKVDIDKMAVDLVNDFTTVASLKDIKLHTINNKNGSKVKADKLYLRQVLDNLLSNAIKFSPPGQEVELILKDEGDSVVATVLDNGPGISEEEMDKLFKEYAVLSAKPTGNESSTGLGLAIAKNYVEQMGGKIWCESKKGHGASFNVSFEKA